jgi:hypothetical protein
MPKPSPKKPDIEFEPDAWARFETLIKSAAKMGHQPHKVTWFTRARLPSVPHRVSEAGMLASAAVGLWALGLPETMPPPQTLLLFFVAALCVGGGVHFWQVARTPKPPIASTEQPTSPPPPPSKPGDTNNSGNSGIITKDQNGDNVINPSVHFVEDLPSKQNPDGSRVLESLFRLDTQHHPVNFMTVAIKKEDAMIIGPPPMNYYIQLIPRNGGPFLSYSPRESEDAYGLRLQTPTAGEYVVRTRVKSVDIRPRIQIWIE